MSDQQAHDNGGYVNDPKDNSLKIKALPVAPPLDEEDDEVDLSFGIGPFRSKLLGKCFSNMYVFVVCAGLAGMVSRMGPTTISGHMMGLKAQYNLNDGQIADFPMMNNVGTVITTLAIAHFGKKSHIPFIIGLCAFTNGLLLMIPAFVHFAKPYHLPGKEAADPQQMMMMLMTQMCVPPTNGSGSIPMMPPRDDDRLGYDLFMTVMTLSGMVTPSFFVLPPIFIDNNTVKKARTGILMGITTVLMEISVPVGLFINRATVKEPVDLKDTSLDPKDPRFVGAWWIPLLIFGVLGVTIGIPMMLFPRHLISPKRQKMALEKAKIAFVGGEKTDTGMASNGNGKLNGDSPPTYQETNGERRNSLYPPAATTTERRASLIGDVVYSQPVEKEGASLAELLKEVPSTMLRLLKNPFFVLTIFFILMVTIIMRGAETFRFTYPVYEYDYDLEDALLFSSLSVGIGMISGTFFSGFLSSRTKSKGGLVLIMVFAYLAAAAITPVVLAFPCDTVKFHGLDDAKYGIPVNGSDVCSCQNGFIAPVCGADGNTYYSPCYAGCTGRTPDMMGYVNCSLLENFDKGDTAANLPCPRNCENGFWAFIVIMGLGIFAFQASLIPAELLIIRSVEPRDRSFGIGCLFFAMILLAIPAPKMFGSMYDNLGCIAKIGNICVGYDREIIRYILTGMDTSAYGGAFLVVCTMYLVTKYQDRKERKKKARKQLSVMTPPSVNVYKM
ncbi:solute carrier organic anion transporter family member 2A1 [Aplysia californica]|uniref:Solute carrier organic anion transporter family member 2A1 n=1 Tax=Aplysia californica TaxID=6500 RepID=A0ABM1A5U9_APLCA|nr:solute carrier organic anion transporter family member 2A1 [Aplysia californica]